MADVYAFGEQSVKRIAKVVRRVEGASQESFEPRPGTTQGQNWQILGVSDDDPVTHAGYDYYTAHVQLFDWEAGTWDTLSSDLPVWLIQFQKADLTHDGTAAYAAKQIGSANPDDEGERPLFVTTEMPYLTDIDCDIDKTYST